MNYKSLISLSLKSGCAVRESELLSKHTTFRVGGPADLFIDVKNSAALKLIISEIKKNNLPYFIIGNGSNLLVSDSGYRGVVIRLSGEFDSVKIIDNHMICGAGTSLAKVCVEAFKAGLSGLEFAWGIPGSCGGAVFMNAGAYGKEMSSVLVSATHLNENNEIETFNKNELELSYRNSVYSNNKFVIISLKLKLQKDNINDIKLRMQDYISRRKSKQPLEFPSAGSIFKRPPGYFVAPLIEKHGLKGEKIGGAMVSTKHCGFIINKNDATCKDILSLINKIKSKIYEKEGIKLKTEVKFLE